MATQAGQERVDHSVVQWNDPAENGEAVDISSTDHTVTDSVGGRGLYVGVAGDVKVDMAGGTALTFKNLPVGIHAIRATKVYKVGTTATDMLILF